MKKGALGTVIVVLIIFFVGCSYFSNQLSEKETNALIGTWDCLDENSAGSLVYITKNDNGLTFRYDGEEGAYILILQSNENIILYSSITTPEIYGVSQPMEYKRVKK